MKSNTFCRERTARRLLSVLLMLVITVFSVLPAAAEEGAAEAASYADPAVMPSNATEGWPKAADTVSDFVCVMDAGTGAILCEKGMDVETPPASLTKIMTTLVAIENGDLDAQVTMTETGVGYAVSGSSNLYTQVGEVFTLRDMLYGTMLKSANDIATQVGEFVGGGSLDTFLSMMNERAAQLGCTGTNFANACGMPNEEHHSTAHDLALISREALKNSLFREIVHTKQYTIPATNLTDSRTFENHHKFLVTDEYAYDGIIGGKTGYTDLAGSCLATYVERGGRTVICIALHSMGMDNCLQDTRRLCDYGLDEFENVPAPVGEGELISGGMLTLPKGASAEECDVASVTETREDGYEETTSVYSWHGREVGTAVTEKPPVTSEPESVPESAAESAASGTVSEPEPAIPTAGAADSAEGHFSGAGSSQTVLMDEIVLPVIGPVGLVPLFLIVMLILILIIMVLIVIIIRRRR